jgi:ribosomal protein S18 acetylase RimI-like enzyme
MDQWLVEDKTSMNVRKTSSADVQALKVVLEDTELFPSDMLSGMISKFLSGDESHDIWLTCESKGNVVGFCYAAPEKLTDGTWNMLVIAVHSESQGKGAGAAIIKRLEAELRERGQRILIADTSGTDEFKQVRNFYRKNGYSEEARIRGFWAVGNDKVVFWKSL